MIMLQPGLFFKFDWYSAVWDQISVNEVAQYYQLPSLFSEDVNKVFETNIGAIDYIGYDWNGVKFFVDKLSYKEIPDSIKLEKGLFFCKFPKVKIDLSGTALDWLRANVFNHKYIGDLDNFLRIRLPIIDYDSNGRPIFRGHVTRTDAAFDFVNIKDDQFQSMLEWCTEWIKEHDRILIRGMPGGIKFEVHLGSSRKTLYLGRSTSTRLLRIYDKRLQYYDKGLNIWKYDIGDYRLPYDHPNSWWRLEYQCRRDDAETILYQQLGQDNLEEFATNLLGVIFDRYAFRDPNYSIDHREAKVLDFWEELAPDWDKYQGLSKIFISRNPDNVLSKSIKYQTTIGLKSNLVNISSLGWQAYKDLYDSELIRIQKEAEKKVSSGDSPDLISAIRYQSIFNAMLQSPVADHSLSNLPGLMVNSDGYWVTAPLVNTMKVDCIDNV